jgi:membrane associated rhomboid family serine protease
MIPLRDNVRSRTVPFINYLLIAANARVFLHELALGRNLEPFIRRYGLVPAVLTQPRLALHLSLSDKVKPLFTSMFLHGGWLHVLGNMLYLWVFGRGIEDLIGSGPFLAFYLVCGLAAGVLQVVTSPYSQLPTIGASGAIAGVMGAYVIRFSRARIVTLVFIVVFITTVEIPAWILLVWWFVIQLFNGFGSLATANYSGGGTAWFAHVGGFLAGMLLIRAFPVKQRKWRPWHEED